jgi:Skp family chaperone for outer membrane proteins
MAERLIEYAHAMRQVTAALEAARARAAITLQALRDELAHARQVYDAELVTLAQQRDRLRAEIVTLQQQRALAAQALQRQLEELLRVGGERV